MALWTARGVPFADSLVPPLPLLLSAVRLLPSQTIHSDNSSPPATNLMKDAFPAGQRKADTPYKDTTELTSSIVCVTQLLCSMLVRRSFRFFDFRFPFGPGIMQSVQRPGYGLNGPGRKSRQGARDFSLFQNVQALFGAHPSSMQWVPGVKRTGREVDHSPLSGAEAKNRWSFCSPPYAFTVWRGVNLLAYITFRLPL